MKKEGVQPNDYSYNSAISACEKGGAKYTDTALGLFHEMKKAGVNPDDVTYRAITQACFNSNRYSEALKSAREAARFGFKERPMHIKITKQNDQLEWDLHELIKASACMLLADALLSLVRSISDGTPKSYQDIIVITGKGLNTKNPNGSVLREKVPAFLNDVAGLNTTAVKENEGIFLITAASLKKWAASGAYEEFKGIFQ